MQMQNDPRYAPLCKTKEVHICTYLAKCVKTNPAFKFWGLDHQNLHVESLPVKSSYNMVVVHGRRKRMQTALPH